MLIKTIRELKKRVVIIFCASSIVVFSQEKKLNVPSYILLPQDTIISNNLLKSLNGFLSQKEKPNNENTFILKEDMLATYALIDEMKEIEKSGKYKDDNFYKGYLTNIIATGTTDYLVQFSYIGVNENIPILRANFELIAKQKNNQFYFSSALQKNTSTWKTEKVGNFLITYKSVLNKIKIGKYINKVYEFDKKIGSNFITELYLCDNFFDSLKLLGVNYKLEYNSVISNSLSSRNDLKLLLINGELYSNPKLFDPHDLWHERLHNVLSTSIINKPVDEGCAYLYGGSWGISWAEIQNMFKLKVSYNTQTDWLSLYETFYNFGESEEQNLLVPYVINAFFVQKIEKEKGFKSVMELLSCGKYEITNKKYFATLEKLTGINKINFNDNVWKLIKESGK